MVKKKSSTKIVKEIKRATRRRYTLEENIWIVLEELRGKESIAEVCRKEQINPNVYCRWSKTFMEVGKRQLSGDTQREANTDEVKELR
ncbi:MAG: transposase [Bacteroidota bacterium]